MDEEEVFFALIPSFPYPLPAPKNPCRGVGGVFAGFAGALKPICFWGEATNLAIVYLFVYGGGNEADIGFYPPACVHARLFAYPCTVPLR